MGLKEECGVFGIYDTKGGAALQTYYALYALQHRGQESCGIATINDRELTSHRALGLVGDNFSHTILDELNGTMAVGHVRYAPSDSASDVIDNAQPLTLRYVKGTLALAHNGSLTNGNELREQYEYNGAIFHTSTDAEIIAYVIAQERLKCDSIEEAMGHAMNHLRGAFSLIVMSPQKLIAARDPWGFRPLCIGRRGDAIIFASESCALDSIGAEYVRELDPGEIVAVIDGEIVSYREHCRDVNHLCIFEYIYFARPDSVIDGQSVHDARLSAGRYLAKAHPVDADVVIGVPDSGLSAAEGYALESKIPFQTGFIKNRYIGRTFIAPTQQEREEAVRIKLNPMRATIEGKRVIMIDDSIVRGTTSAQIVRLLRSAGASEVHVRIASPEYIAPCYYGTDIPDKTFLVATMYDTPALAKYIGADSLGFLPIGDLDKIAPNARPGFCDACFTENHPVPKGCS